MVVMILTTLLAGLFGLVAAQAEDAEAYLTRVRLLLLGSVALGYVGVAWFSWRRGPRVKGVIAMLTGLVVVHALYPLVLILPVILTARLEWLARMLGVEAASSAVHYSIAMFVAAFALLFSLMAATAVVNIKSIKWALVLLLLVGVVVVNATEPGWSLNPHPFRQSGAAPAERGPNAWAVAKDTERPWRTRLKGLFSASFYVALPATGWGGDVRAELSRRFKGNPDASLSERVTSLEAALLKARR